MLTVTYALVTISVEQKKARGMLSVLQQQIERNAQELKAPDRSCFESVLYQLVQFDEACRWRNVERYVIPTLRRVSKEADALISELDALSCRADGILRSVRGRARQAFEQGTDGIGELYRSMEQYCHNLFQRLAKEEEELLPIAQRVIPSEEWFDIAAQFISHDAEVHAHKHTPHTMPIHASAQRSAGLYQLPN
jgi:hypothetical protein